MAQAKMVRAIRPMRNTYIAVAHLLETDKYLDMTMGKFVGIVMQKTGGSANPQAVAELYKKLIEEAGV